MSFGYDCETDNMLYNVFDTVWADLHATRSQAVSIENMSKTRIAITKNLLTAAAVGLRDPTTLKFVALQGIVVPEIQAEPPGPAKNDAFVEGGLKTTLPTQRWTDENPDRLRPATHGE
jgi:hypothetical protein